MKAKQLPTLVFSDFDKTYSITAGDGVPSGPRPFYVVVDVEGKHVVYRPKNEKEISVKLSCTAKPSNL